MSEDTSPRLVAVNRGVEAAAGATARRGPRHAALEAWVGRWINGGSPRGRRRRNGRTGDGTTYVTSMEVTLVKVC